MKHYLYTFSILLFLIMGVRSISFGQILFTVNSTADAPDIAINGVCDAGGGMCTLRAAMQEANAMPGPNFITFNIGGSGPRTINLVNSLPVLTDNAGVIIDGLSQPGATTGPTPPATANLLIEVNALSAGAAPAFYIVSDNNIIQGLVINRAQEDGIRIEASIDTTANNMVFCNFIGTDLMGLIPVMNGINLMNFWGGVSIVTPVPCAHGFVSAYNIVDHNLISANYAQGVNISMCPPGDVFGNTVSHNYIGTDVSGQFGIGNQHDGVYIGEGAHHNTVDHNIICDNRYEGVSIVGVGFTIPPSYTHNNVLSSNKIGLNVNGAPLKNFGNGVSIGIYGSGAGPGLQQNLGFAIYNTVLGNEIAWNSNNGITVFELSPFTADGDGNKICQNQISNNAGLGIDLNNDNVTLNDVGDFDNTANEGCNFPIILSASIQGGVTTIGGTVDVPNPLGATIEVFLAAPDPGNYGEGLVWLGSCTPDAIGQWTLITTVPISTSDALTATATDMYNNTSEFALNFTNITSNVDLFIPNCKLDFSLYPNPASGKVRLDFNYPPAAETIISVFGADGRLQNGHREFRPDDQNGMEISIFGFPCGTYIVKAANGSAVTNRLLFVQ